MLAVGGETDVKHLLGSAGNTAAHCDLCKAHTQMESKATDNKSYNNNN